MEFISYSKKIRLKRELCMYVDSGKTIKQIDQVGVPRNVSSGMSVLACKLHVLHLNLSPTYGHQQLLVIQQLKNLTCAPCLTTCHPVVPFLKRTCISMYHEKYPRTKYKSNHWLLATPRKPLWFVHHN